MSEPKSGQGSSASSSGGGGKKGGAGVAVVVGAVLLGAVLLGGPKIKAMLGGKAEADSAEGAAGKGAKKKRKVKRVVNGEEREVEELVDDETAAMLQPPTDPIELDRWNKAAAERKKHAEERLEIYMRESRLGPETHSMGEEGVGYDGITKPNARHERPISLARVNTNPNTKDRPAPYDDKNQKFALLTGDVYNVYPGLPMRARLTVTQGNPDIAGQGGAQAATQPIAVNIVSARLTKRGPDGKVAVLSDFPMNDRGQFGDEAAGDNVFSGALDPAKVKGLDGEVNLTVVFTAPGEKDEFAVNLDWNVIANPHARITGPTGDAVNDQQSLEIYLGVEVTDPGTYYFQGVLADSKGTDLGWAEVRPTLDKGKSSVTFTF